MNERQSIETDKLFFRQWLALGLVLLIICGLLTAVLANQHTQLTVIEEDRLRAQVRVIDQNLGRQFKAVYGAMSSVLRELPSWQLRNAWDDATIHLEALCSAMPGVRTLNILDVNGVSLTSNRQGIAGTDFSSRQYFLQAKASNDTNRLMITPPFLTTFGLWGINLVATYQNENGMFGGIITATLDPDYFEILLRSVLYSPDMWSAIAHCGGNLFLMNPQRQDLTNVNLAQPGSFFTRHMESGGVESVLKGTVYTTGENRMIAQRTVRPEDIPLDTCLVVAVSRDLDIIYEEWRHDLTVQSFIVLMIGAISVPGLYIYQRGRRKDLILQAHLNTELRLGEERLKLAAESAGFGVWEYDLDSLRLVWDKAMFSIYGINPEDFSHSYDEWRRRLPLEDAETVESNFQRLQEAGETYTGEFRIHRDDGQERIILSKCGLYRGHDGRATRMIGINEDITARKAMENELRLARDTLEERVRERTIDLERTMEELGVAKDRAESANRMKSDFLVNISHELRTPLNPIIGMADLLLDTPLEDEQRQCLNSLREAAGRLQSMIEVIITLSSLDTYLPDKQPFSVKSLLDAIDAKFGSMARAKGLIFDCTTPLDLPPIFVSDQRLLGMMLDILTDNAVKFTRTGRVAVIVEFEKTDHGGTQARFSVRDSGVGIAPDKLAQVVAGLTQADAPLTKRFGGLGLGLATVRKILELLGADLVVKSEQDKGSEFSVSLSVAACSILDKDECLAEIS